MIRCYLTVRCDKCGAETAPYLPENLERSGCLPGVSRRRVGGRRVSRRRAERPDDMVCAVCGLSLCWIRPGRWRHNANRHTPGCGKTPRAMTRTDYEGYLEKVAAAVRRVAERRPA